MLLGNVSDQLRRILPDLESVLKHLRPFFLLISTLRQNFGRTATSKSSNSVRYILQKSDLHVFSFPKAFLNILQDQYRLMRRVFGPLLAHFEPFCCSFCLSLTCLRASLRTLVTAFCRSWMLEVLKVAAGRCSEALGDRFGAHF